ncbi:MAG: hydantoinase/oxoprolinase family protein [Hyphomicrobiaceae bacterium]
MTDPQRYLIGIDVGGTFTDIIVLDRTSGRTHAAKVSSDRAEPERAVLEGITKAGVPADDIALIVHGTTVATNALLERRGARTALVTTAGFRDVLELGRTTRLVPGTLYDPYFRRPSPLVPRRHRRVVTERILADGSVETPLDTAALETLARELAAEGIESVAVGFLNSFRNPAHENEAAGILSRHFAFVTISTGVLNEIREFERFSAAAINAYVMPVMARYTDRLRQTVKLRYRNAGFYTIGSNGGLLSAGDVAAQPVRTILSGPAAGIAASIDLGQTIGATNLITYDMGGTSTDVALIADGVFPLKRETLLEGMVVRVPQLDIHTVGAGGGSIARLDSGGLLHVGPESAGASPGPACYGRGGTLATVTDANVVLGRLGGDQELGGTLRIDRHAAERALAMLASAAGLSAREMAAAILEIAVARMATAVHEISVARGHDPREFALLCYGGAGPLHAALVADELGIGEVIVPPAPGAFSARGALSSALSKDRSATVLLPLDADKLATVWTLMDGLAADLADSFAAEGLSPAHLIVECQLDLRYRGQAHELTVTLPRGGEIATLVELFEIQFEREFGRRDRGRGIEIVNLRAVATLPSRKPAWQPAVPPTENAQPITRELMVSGVMRSCPVWRREDLRGEPLAGPLVVEEMSATTYLPPGWTLSIGRAGELRLTRSNR